MDGRTYVITSSQQETSVENVFAVGDVANPLAPTISGAVGAGATAARVIASRLNAGFQVSNPKPET
jgi:thioredoxin reductase